MPDGVPTHRIKRYSLGLRALIGAALAVSIGLLLLAIDPSPADGMAGVFIGTGVFLAVVALVAPRASHGQV